MESLPSLIPAKAMPFLRGGEKGMKDQKHWAGIHGPNGPRHTHGLHCHFDLHHGVKEGEKIRNHTLRRKGSASQKLLSGACEKFSKHLLCIVLANSMILPQWSVQASLPSADDFLFPVPSMDYTFLHLILSLPPLSHPVTHPRLHFGVHQADSGAVSVSRKQPISHRLQAGDEGHLNVHP